MKLCAHRHCKKKFKRLHSSQKYCLKWCSDDEYRMRRDDTKHKVCYPPDRESWCKRRLNSVKRKLKVRAERKPVVRVEATPQQIPAYRPSFNAGTVQGGTPEQLIRQLNKWTRNEANYSETLLKARV